MSIFEQKKYENLAKKASENSKSSVDILIKMLKLASNQKPNLPDDVFYKKVFAQFDLEEEGKVVNEPMVLLSTSNILDEQIKKQVDEYQQEYSEISARGDLGQAFAVFKQKLFDLRNVIQTELQEIKDKYNLTRNNLKQNLLNENQAKINEKKTLIEQAKNNLKDPNIETSERKILRQEIKEYNEELKEIFENIKTRIENNEEIINLKTKFALTSKSFEAIKEHYNSFSGTIKGLKPTVEKVRTDLTSSEQEIYNDKVKKNETELRKISENINTIAKDPNKSFDEKMREVQEYYVSRDVKFAMITFFQLQNIEIKPSPSGKKRPIKSTDYTFVPINNLVESIKNEDQDFRENVIKKIFDLKLNPATGVTEPGPNSGNFDLKAWLSGNLKQQTFNDFKPQRTTSFEDLNPGANSNFGKLDRETEDIINTGNQGPQSLENINKITNSIKFYETIIAQVEQRLKEDPNFTVGGLLMQTVYDVTNEKKRIEALPTEEQRLDANKKLNRNIQKRLSPEFIDANTIIKEHLANLRIPEKINAILNTVDVNKLPDKAKDIVKQYKQNNNLPGGKNQTEVEAFKAVLTSIYEAQITYDLIKAINEIKKRISFGQLGETDAKVSEEDFIRSQITEKAQKLSENQEDFIAAAESILTKQNISQYKPILFPLFFTQIATDEIKNYPDYSEKTPEEKLNIRKQIAKEIIKKIHPQIAVGQDPIRFGLPTIDDKNEQKSTRKIDYDKLVNYYQEKLKIMYETKSSPFQPKKEITISEKLNLMIKKYAFKR